MFLKVSRELWTCSWTSLYDHLFQSDHLSVLWNCLLSIKSSYLRPLLSNYSFWLSDQLSGILSGCLGEVLLVFYQACICVSDVLCRLSCYSVCYILILQNYPVVIILLFPRWECCNHYSSLYCIAALYVVFCGGWELGTLTLSFIYGIFHCSLFSVSVEWEQDLCNTSHTFPWCNWKNEDCTWPAKRWFVLFGLSRENE